jgi:signal transduction histidine kinase
MRSVPIDFRSLSVETAAKGGRLTIRIGDTGRGIDPAVAARLFEPFQTTKASGLGLGLAVCRTLVEAHGGTIQVERDSPRGTTFLISLPLDQDAEEWNIDTLIPLVLDPPDPHGSAGRGGD